MVALTGPLTPGFGQGQISPASGHDAYQIVGNEEEKGEKICPYNTLNPLVRIGIQNLLFLKVVMLHVKLKGPMSITTYASNYFDLTHTSGFWGGLKCQMFKLSN